MQFETIHPYLDGNGRLGRLPVTLLLEEWSQLSKPLLYLSLFFKRRREDYYRILNHVRTEGDWEGWTAFNQMAAGWGCGPAFESAQGVLGRSESLVGLGVELERWIRWGQGVWNDSRELFTLDGFAIVGARDPCHGC